MPAFALVGLILTVYHDTISLIRDHPSYKDGQLIKHSVKNLLKEQTKFQDTILRVLSPVVLVPELKDLLDPNSALFVLWENPQFLQAVDQACDGEKALSIVLLEYSLILLLFALDLVSRKMVSMSCCFGLLEDVSHSPTSAPNPE